MGCGVRKYCLYSRGDTFALHGSNSFQIHQKENREGKRKYSSQKSDASVYLPEKNFKKPHTCHAVSNKEFRGDLQQTYNVTENIVLFSCSFVLGRVRVLLRSPISTIFYPEVELSYL